MVSTTEIDWVVEMLDYMVSYQKDMISVEKVYDILQDFWHNEPIDKCSIGIVSESDGKEHWFDVSSFLSSAPFLVEENMLARFDTNQII